MNLCSIRKSLRAVSWALCLALFVVGCAKGGGDATTRTSDTCFELPGACGAVYSPDGKYMAFAAASEVSSIEQVYRVSLVLREAKPEVVSIDSDGHVSNGSCMNIRFLANGDLVFECTSTNLLEGSGARSFRKAGDAPLVAYSLP